MFRNAKVALPIENPQCIIKQPQLSGLWEDSVGMLRVYLSPAKDCDGYRVLNETGGKQNEILKVSSQKIKWFAVTHRKRFSSKLRTLVVGTGRGHHLLQVLDRNKNGGIRPGGKVYPIRDVRILTRKAFVPRQYLRVRIVDHGEKRYMFDSSADSDDFVSILKQKSNSMGGIASEAEEEGTTLLNYVNDDTTDIILSAPWGAGGKTRNYQGNVEPHGTKITWFGKNGNVEWERITDGLGTDGRANDY